MSQHDFTIAGGTGRGGLDVRTDIQDALQALATNNKGNAAPATLYQNQRWTDGDTPSATIWTDYIYDGVDHIPTGKIDTTNNRYLVHGAGVPIAPGGRITLESGVDKSVADQTGKTSIFYALSAHNWIPIWDGSRWDNYEFSQLTLPLNSNAGHTGYHQGGKPFDVWATLSGGSPLLGTGPAWTDNTTRSAGTALTRKDGRYVNNTTMTLRFGTASGDTMSVSANQALYLGTIYTSADGQCEDSLLKRYVWNTYNRAKRPMRVLEATDSWSYASGTIRQARGSSANQVDFIRGLDEDAAVAEVFGRFSQTDASQAGFVHVGLDATNAAATGCIMVGGAGVAGHVTPIMARWSGFPGLGKHYIAWLESTSAVGTTTFSGDGGAPASVQAGLQVEIFA